MGKVSSACSADSRERVLPVLTCLCAALQWWTALRGLSTCAMLSTPGSWWRSSSRRWAFLLQPPSNTSVPQVGWLLVIPRFSPWKLPRLRVLAVRGSLRVREQGRAVVRVPWLVFPTRCCCWNTSQRRGGPSLHGARLPQDLNTPRVCLRAKQRWEAQRQT